jgi:hypothetical protein
MIPINPHAVEATLVAIPTAIAASRKLLRQHNEPAAVQPASTAEKMNQIEQRATTLTETLKNIVGYPHYGLNE